MNIVQGHWHWACVIAADYSVIAYQSHQNGQRLIKISMFQTIDAVDTVLLITACCVSIIMIAQLILSGKHIVITYSAQ